MSILNRIGRCQLRNSPKVLAVPFVAVGHHQMTLTPLIISNVEELLVWFWTLIAFCGTSIDLKLTTLVNLLSDLAIREMILINLLLWFLEGMRAQVLVDDLLADVELVEDTLPLLVAGRGQSECLGTIRHYFRVFGGD